VKHRAPTMLKLWLCCIMLALASARNPRAQALSPWSCLPMYGEAEEILTLYPPTDLWGMRSADFNDDGWPDVVLWRGNFQSGDADPLDILLNDGHGNLTLGTSEVFAGTVPSVVEGRELVLADFNGDGRMDLFIADQGKDLPPHPGRQNTLVLSAPGGKMVDATGNLPQQHAMTHSAAAADIDGDSDVDLYVGNIWGQTDIPPQIWLNLDGQGSFAVGSGRLPFPVEDNDYGAFTTCEFADVDNDGAPDLILGDAGDELEGGPDSLVLLNDGSGSFSHLPNAFPPKPFAPTDIALDIDATDLNGDGHLDLLVAFTKSDPNYQGRYIQILINNGDGTFRDETPTRLPQSDNLDAWPSWICLLDLDMDGSLDIVVAPLGDTRGPLFYLNDGHGAFRPLSNVFNIGSDNVFTFLDVDRDGYLDVLWSWPGIPEYHYLVRALGCPLYLPMLLH
jgi:hypothetical protein